jgi:2-polyprenyl-6-methoxyphenol hydroxylase-like FAD-dependent oxidoreductase
MSQPLKIVIVGAGIGGLACAIASGRQGFDVVVLERAEKLTPVSPSLHLPPIAEILRNMPLFPYPTTKSKIQPHSSEQESKSHRMHPESGHNTAY